MLRNLNDVITLFTLIALVVMTVRISFGTLFNFGSNNDDDDFWTLLKNYRENEED